MVEGMTEAMVRQLDAAQAITHIGSWLWDVPSGVVSWSDELYRIYGIEPGSKDITFDVFLAALVPEDRGRIRGEIEAAMARGGRFSYRERIARPDGEIRVLDTIGEVIHASDGKPCGLIGTCRDVTDEIALTEAKQRAERVQAGERHALEQLASGVALRDVLTTIVHMIEDLSPRSIASILLLDPRGRYLKHGAAPNLPDEYNRALDGAEIGPRAGSCGTAAYRG